MSIETAVIGHTTESCRNGHVAVRNKYGQCLECTRKNTRLYRSKNRDKAVKYAKQWQANNPEKAKQHRQDYYQRNKDKVLSKAKTYSQNNLESIRRITRVNTAKRRARIRLRIPAWANLPLIRDFYRNCPDGYEVDHIIPINGKNVSGLHVPENLQYLTPEQNRQKGNLFIEVFT